MTSNDVEQWTLLSRSNTMATDTQTPISAPTPTPSPAIELTINAKPADASAEKKVDTECTCGITAKIPKLDRKNTVDSVTDLSEDEWQPRSGRNRRRIYPIRRYSISPVRRRSRTPFVPDTTMVNSPNVLLSKVGNYDGVADLPFPARSSIFLATFPFTDNDVKKWAWLLSRGVEDTFLNEPGNDDDEVYPTMTRNRGRNRSPYYDGPVVINNDIPSVYVSRALDSTVIPEDTKEKIKYMIVVQNRNNPRSGKLVVAEGRKAAGILLYYEALSGNSIAFVGATVDAGKKLGRKKLVKVDTVEEAVKLTEEEGVVGIIC